MSRVRNLIDFNHRVMDMDGDSTDTISINEINVDTLSTSTAIGVPALTSPSSINLTAGTGINDRVAVTQSSFQLGSFTTAQIALKTGTNGDLVYDRDLHKIQAYANGVWTDLNSDPGLTGITDNATGSVITLGDALISSVVPVQLGNLTITGTLTVEGTTVTIDSVGAQTVDLGDGDQIRLGDSNDFTMTWNSTQAVVNALGTTKFQSSGTDQLIVSATGVTVDNTLSIAEIIENVDIDTSTNATLNFDFNTSAVKFLNTAQTANRTINFRGDVSNSLDSIMDIGKSITCAVLATQGVTPYYLASYQIDGGAVTPVWAGGSAPSAGNANSVDIYSFTIIKTAASTFSVFASQTQYA